MKMVTAAVPAADSPGGGRLIKSAPLALSLSVVSL